jgi:hypothetical protein
MAAASHLETGQGQLSNIARLPLASPEISTKGNEEKNPTLE